MRTTSSASQGVRALLKLLWCEFAKLRRKPLFFAAAAVSALIPLGCALFLPDFQEFTSGAEAVDGMMSTLFQMSAYLLLMPALVVLASNLLFEEQDNDTLKNLMTRAGEQTDPGHGKDGPAVSLFHRFHGGGRPGDPADRAGRRVGAGGLLAALFCGRRPGDHDVGRGIALHPAGGAAEPELYRLRHHHLLLHICQLHLRPERPLYHPALRPEPGGRCCPGR